MITKKYDYQEIKRKSVNNKRLYDTKSGFLPSVTTILGETKPPEAVKALNEWRNRVGHSEATRITKEAANVGTIMHGYLEQWLLNDKFEAGKNLPSIVAKRMANKVIENIEPHLSEVWGSEIKLYYPGLYAGTADACGIWKNRPTVMDFKQANRMKKKEWIEDYFGQGCLYAEAHNQLFNTDIKSVAIFMCSRDCEFQSFEIVDDEYDDYAARAAKRVEKYYEMTGH